MTFRSLSEDPVFAVRMEVSESIASKVLQVIKCRKVPKPPSRAISHTFCKCPVAREAVGQLTVRLRAWRVFDKEGCQRSCEAKF